MAEGLIASIIEMAVCISFSYLFFYVLEIIVGPMPQNVESNIKSLTIGILAAYICYLHKSSWRRKIWY